MAVTLAPDEFSDAAVTDGIGAGDVGCAARLWVRFWPTALSAAQELVDPAEVPGLAAEALIGTIASIAIGRGPREDVAGFVTAAVRELGEDDDPVPGPAPAAGHPDLFVSPMMTAAFSELDEETQRVLRDTALDRRADAQSLRALTVLQHYYLAEHSDGAGTPDCRRLHVALMAVAEGSISTLSRETWLHLSTCAWCTEAFHEVAFSNVALGELVDRAVLDRVAAAPVTALVVPPSEPVGAPPIEATLADDLLGSEEESEVAELPFPPEPPIEDERVPAAGLATAGFLRGRGRLAAGAVTALTAIAVVAVVLNGAGDGGASPTATKTSPTVSALPDLSTPSTPASPAPSATTSVVAPSDTPTATPRTTSTPTATQKPKPTKAAPKPSSTPTHSATPTPTKAPTTATPTPTPTATPTKTCNPLQHLLGFC
jgi:hypothetical protein